jgi:hypothetical protein
VWVARSPSQEDKRREAVSTPSLHAGSTPSETRNAVVDPSEPMTIEFVDVPAERAPPAGARGPHADHFPASRTPSKGLANVDHSDGGAKTAPSGKVGSGAVPTPSPSGTAAFGSARD